MQEVAKLSSSAAAGTSRSTMDFSNGGCLSVPPAVVSSSTAENKKDSRRRAASEAAASSAPSFQWETFSYPSETDSHVVGATDRIDSNSLDVVSRSSFGESSHRNSLPHLEALEALSLSSSSLHMPNNKTNRSDSTSSNSSTRRISKASNDSPTTKSFPATSSSSGPAQMKILSLQSEVQRLQSVVSNMHHSLDRATSSSKRHKQKSLLLQQRLQLSEQENATLRQENHDLRTLLKLEEEARIMDHLSTFEDHDEAPSVPQEVRVGATVEMETNHTLVMEKTNAASTEPQEMPEQVQRRDFGNLAA